MKRTQRKSVSIVRYCACLNPAGCRGGLGLQLGGEEVSLGAIRGKVEQVNEEMKMNGTRRSSSRGISTWLSLGHWGGARTLHAGTRSHPKSFTKVPMCRRGLSPKEWPSSCYKKLPCSSVWYKNALSANDIIYTLQDCSHTQWGSQFRKSTMYSLQKGSWEALSEGDNERT